VYTFIVSKKITCSFFIGVLCGALGVIQVAPSVVPHQEEPHSLFVYGTLQNNLIRYYACRCLVPETPVTLPGYQKVGLNIVPVENNSVSGSILHISTTHLERIDGYENIPQKYRREQIVIDNETHWVYLKNI
jgi:gamma-glutamylcyclotransferase (GGCT)/AIG2-like uncharacterized protein YtfP